MLRTFAVPLLLLSAAAAMAACGFQPLYAERGDGGSAARDLAEVEVGPIPDRIGQQVRNNLLDLVNPQGRPKNPRHRLEVKLKEKKTGLAVESDDTVSRINLTLTGNFILRQTGTGKAVFAGAARTIAAYNITSADYANLIAERNARKRAAGAVADEITRRLSVYFKTRAAASD